MQCVNDNRQFNFKGLENGVMRNGESLYFQKRFEECVCVCVCVVQQPNDFGN